MCVCDTYQSTVCVRSDARHLKLRQFCIWEQLHQTQFTELLQGVGGGLQGGVACNYGVQ